ncbi:MAG: hypothetical protein ACYDC5_00960 [Candidatus Dormibacteria bacterium]
MSGPRLPSPTSGPSVTSYILLCLLVAAVVLVTLTVLGATLPNGLSGFRLALGMRPS